MLLKIAKEAAPVGSRLSITHHHLPCKGDYLQNRVLHCPFATLHNLHIDADMAGGAIAGWLPTVNLCLILSYSSDTRESDFPLIPIHCFLARPNPLPSLYSHFLHLRQHKLVSFSGPWASCLSASLGGESLMEWILGTVGCIFRHRANQTSFMQW